MRALNRFFDHLLYAGTAVTSIAFFLIIIVAVTSRYILKAPILASIEFSRILFVWSSFLAAAIAYRRKAHVVITFIYDKFPAAVQRIARLAVHALVLFFAAGIFYHSIIIIKLFWQTKLPMLQVSQSLFYLPVPIVFFLIISYTIEFISDELSTAEV